MLQNSFYQYIMTFSAKFNPFVVIFTCLIIFQRCQGTEPLCGGTLESDGGTFKIPDDLDSDFESGTLTCVWIIQVLSSNSINFTLHDLAKNSTLSLYPVQQLSQLPVPAVRLTDENVGSSIEIPGQAVILVLPQNRSSNAISFSWDVTSPSNSLANVRNQNKKQEGESVIYGSNYALSDQGEVTWRELNQPQRIVWALNFPTSQRLLNLHVELKLQSCDLDDPCQCSHFGLFEILPSGVLREFSRVCSRSQHIQAGDVLPHLLAFVFIGTSKNLGQVEEHVKLKWWPELDEEIPTAATTLATTSTRRTEEPVITTTTTTTTTVTTPGPEGPPANFTGCGDVLTNFTSGRIRYKLNEPLEPRERCVWIVDVGLNASIAFRLLAEGSIGLSASSMSPTGVIHTYVSLAQNFGNLNHWYNKTGINHVIFQFIGRNGVNAGTGFEIEIASNPLPPNSQPTFPITGIIKQEIIGSFLVPTVNTTDEVVVMVINPLPARVFNLTVTFTQNNYLDFCNVEALRVHAVSDDRNHLGMLGMYCLHNFDVHVLSTQQDLILVTFQRLQLSSASSSPRLAWQ